MKKLLRTCFYLWIFTVIGLSNPCFSNAIDIESVSKRLEKSLNNKRKNEIQSIASKAIAKEIKQKYENFLIKFPNAKWVIKPSKQLKDKRESIEIIVTGDKKTSAQNYHLMSKQRLAIKTMNGKIIEHEILSDYSILIEK